MSNLLVNAGRAILTARLSGGGTEPKQIGVGTGAGGTAVTDTSLFTETSAGSRIAGTSSQVSTAVPNDTYQVTGTLVASAPISVTNAGLFDNSTPGQGNLFLKDDFSTVSLAAGDSLALTFKLQLQ